MGCVMTADNAVRSVQRDILPVGQLFSEPHLLVVSISASLPDGWFPLDKRV